MPKAFKAVFYRLTCFFVIGALCVGIVVPYNDPTLLAAIKDGAPGAAASPYVIAMQHLGIGVLPHIVNGTHSHCSFLCGKLIHLLCIAYAVPLLPSLVMLPRYFLDALNVVFPFTLFC